MKEEEKKKESLITKIEFLKRTVAGTLGLVTASTTSGDAYDVFADDNSTGSAYANHLVGPERAIDKTVSVEVPKETIRYDIIDSHLHFTDFIGDTDGFPILCKAMDASGVSKAIIFGLGIVKQWDGTMKEAPAYYLSNDSRCYYYSATDYFLAEQLLAEPKEIRERFYPFCCGFNCNDRFAADQVERLLNLYPKFWNGIGELMSRHDELTALTYGEPPHIDSEGFFGIFDLAAAKGLPVLVHHNVTAQNTDKILYTDELKKALAHNRKCKIIWAHVGISRRVEVKNLIQIADELF